MIRETLPVDRALSLGMELPYALVRSFSSVRFGQTPVEVDADELVEGRFFSEDEEIRVYRDGRELKAVRVREDGGDHVIEETYQIANRAFGAALTIRKYLDFDVDGQASVALSRLSGWKGGPSNG